MPRKKNPDTPVRRGSKKSVERNLSLDDIIATLQSLGYKITPASSEVDREKQEKSLNKLGIVRGEDPVPVVPVQDLTLTLTCTHTLSGKSYGPGKVTIPHEQEALYRTLVHQEQLARAEFYDTAEYHPQQSLFVISTSVDGTKVYKTQVPPGVFANLDALPPSMTFGRIDAPGYNPDTYYRNGTF